jgi:L-Ala-D/L-Glu epimerase / N-acetyl-D-glutamate racemase
MQIIKAEVTPVELQLRHPVLIANHPLIERVAAIFVRIDTRQGQCAWGCTIAHPTLNGEREEDVLYLCREAATIIPDLHPTNLEYSVDRIAEIAGKSPAAMCAYDLAFHDLLGLFAGMPLYRILGGYRNRIQTSITIPLSSVEESVEIAGRYARMGFLMLKIKGGRNPEEDVRRVQAIHRAFPHQILRLDADSGYSVEEAIDVACALEGLLEVLEQPTASDDLEGLKRVTEHCPVTVLADQSLKGPASALEIAARRAVKGLNIKLAKCGGLRNARQIDGIIRAARIATMVGCFIEPALLIAAGLSLALSSPNVLYADLDGHLDLLNDPSKAGFRLEEGWLIASEVSGLGYTVELD